MNSRTISLEAPLGLLVALLLGSCAMAPDRQVARQDRTSGEPAAAQQHGKPPIPAESRDAGAAPRVGLTAQNSPPSGKESAPASPPQIQPAALTQQPAPPSAGLPDEVTPPTQSRSASPTVPALVKSEKADKSEDKDGEPGPTNPDGALRYRRLQLQDEKGDIPPDGLQKARDHVAQMKVAQQARLKARKQAGLDAQPGVNFAGIEPNSWTWQGPGNIGGRIRSIVIHPASANNMWVGSVSGGIWRTTDGGASWFPVDDFMANLAVTTIIIHPTNSNIMYAGTGEGFGNGDAVQGAGIFKSTDGGVTWNQLPSTANGNFFFVSRLATSPDGTTLLAATSTGIWRSTDGGANWSRRTTAQAFDLDFLPGDGTRAIVGQGGAARFSLDGGATWTTATFAPAITGGRVETAVSPANASIVYAAVDQNNGEIYRSNDGGQSYTRVNAGSNFFLGGAGRSQGWYDNVIWLSPTNADTVIVGGIHLWRGTYAQPNLPLTQISNGSTTNSVHADHHVIVSHPGFNGSTNRIAYFGNDGGLYRAADILTVTQTSGWTGLNNNLGITQFYGAAGNPTSGVIVGGTQDNGTIRFSGNLQQWSAMHGNDGGYSAADLTDPNYFYGESQNLIVHRSTDGGLTSTDIISGLGDSVAGSTNFIAPLVLDPSNANTLLAGGSSLWRSTNVKAATPSWACITDYNGGPMNYNYTRLSGTNGTAVITPTLGHRFVAGNQVNLSFFSGNLLAPVNYSGSFVITGVNGTTTFTVAIVGPNLPNSGTGSGLVSTPNFISAIAVSATNSEFIVVAHNNGDIYRTTNGTATLPIWTKIDTFVPNRLVTRLTIDTTHSFGWIYATFGTFAGDNVYRTTDFGATWADVTGSGATGLPSAPVFSLVFHPSNSNLLYVGTEIGIFTSEDAGATWEPSQDGPANVSVQELFWMGGDLGAATHGRGLYRASGGIYVDKNTPWTEAEQNGSSDRPFKTVTRGKNAATRYQPVWIRPGTYNETMTIDNPNGLELRALGGPVSIGEP